MRAVAPILRHVRIVAAGAVDADAPDKPAAHADDGHAGAKFGTLGPVAPPRIRYTRARSFVLPGGNDIYVTNKYAILSGPLEWLAPIGLSSLRVAMEQSGDRHSQRLYISSDLSDYFDARYPGHLLDVSVAHSEAPGKIAVVVSHERPTPDESVAALDEHLRELVAGPMKRHRGSDFRRKRNPDAPEYVEVSFDVVTRGKTVGDAIAIGEEVLALLRATEGGALTLTTTLDVVRSGHARGLIGQPEGPWFEGKGAAYLLTTDEDKWELAKDVGAFANSETGGLVLIGARTQKKQGIDVVRSVTDIPLALVDVSRYRKVLIAWLHPRVEGLDIATVDHHGGRGVAFIYVPPQREELKPFVTRGVVAAGRIHATHVSIPVRDGQETRYASPAEVHSLLQAGRIALRRTS